MLIDHSEFKRHEIMAEDLLTEQNLEHITEGNPLKDLSISELKVIFSYLSIRLF